MGDGGSASGANVAVPIVVPIAVVADDDPSWTMAYGGKTAVGEDVSDMDGTHWHEKGS